MQILRARGLYLAELWPETCLGETTVFWDNCLEMIVIFIWDCFCFLFCLLLVLCFEWFLGSCAIVIGPSR